LDIRFWNNDQKRKVLESLKDLTPGLPGARLSWRIITETPPMEQTEASRKLLTKVRRIAARMGFSLPAGRSGGGSDASLASQTGRPTLDGLGPEGEGIHAENENLFLPSLIKRTALLAALLMEGPI
jgi:glutamate carboxypeptidase